MILTITPNAALDKTYRIEGFRLDVVNRPDQSFTVAGGKGINTARVYQTLGGTAVATGFLGGSNGDVIRQALAKERIRSEFVRVDGESRLCIAVIDPTTGSQTEINESGPSVSSKNVYDLLATVRALLTAQRFEYVVLCGSLPPGAPELAVCRPDRCLQRARLPDRAGCQWAGAGKRHRSRSLDG